MHVNSLQPVPRETSSHHAGSIQSPSTDLIPGEASTVQTVSIQPASIDLSHGIGPTLRAMRRARDMTQIEVADGAGVSTSTVSEIENGNNNLSIDMLWRLCQAMRVRPHITLRGQDSVRPLLQIELESVGEASIAAN